MGYRTERSPFSPLNEEQFIRHLEEMALQGWRLEEIRGERLCYRQALPRAVRYALAFHPEVGNLDPLPTPSMEFYQDYCLQAGWEPVAVWSAFPQIEVYASLAPDPVPLQTEPRVRWKVLGDWIEQQLVPRAQMSAGLGGLVFLFNAFLLAILYDPHETDWALHILLLAGMGIFLYLVGASIFALIRAYRLRDQVRQAERDGTDCQLDLVPPSRSWSVVLSYVVFYALLLFLMWVELTRGEGVWGAVKVVLYVGCVRLVWWLMDLAKEYLRRWGVSRYVNWVLYGAVLYLAFQAFSLLQDVF